MDALTGAAFIGAGLVQAAITVALYLWGSTVATRRRSRGWWWAAWLPLAALILATIGIIGTVVQLVAAFDAVTGVAPELKAALVADAIAGAMRWTLWTTVPAGFLYVAAIVAFTVGTLLPVPAGGPAIRTPAPAPVPPPA